jgi:cytochrome c553
VRKRAVAMFAAALLFSATAMSAAAADGAAVEKKAAPCFECHGPNSSSTNPLMLSLAGQPRQFITTQLIMFREGRRKDSQMSPIAAPLSNADINELGAYFEAQKPAPPTRKLDSQTAAAGRRLAEQSNCTACHGADLKGQQHVPRLVGQHAEYLRAQLHGFKAGTRFDMVGVMTSAAQPLSEKDIDLLAEYLSGLR